MLSFYDSLSNSLTLKFPSLLSVATAAVVVAGEFYLMARISLSSIMSVTSFASFEFSFRFGVSGGWLLILLKRGGSGRCW